MRRRLMAGLGLLAALLSFSVPVTVAAHDFDGVGTVYTMTNSAAGNAVLAYARAADGSLSLRGTFPTGGLGTGSGLGSQGAVTLSADGRWLAAVDAGSNDVALFAVGPKGDLRLADSVASGGTSPISVTLHGHILYVLDAGGSGNIAGFARIGRHLVALPGSIQPLSGSGTSPEEIAFGPDGGVLVVTEKGAAELVTYRVGFFGIAGPPSVYASAGAAPYGFAFDGRGRLFVSEAAVSALSSYAVSRGRRAQRDLGVHRQRPAGGLLGRPHAGRPLRVHDRRPQPRPDLLVCHCRRWQPHAGQRHRGRLVHGAAPRRIGER